MTDQTKRGIKYEVNSLLLGKGLTKRRVTDEAKELHGAKLGGKEGESRSKYIFPRKVWTTTTKYTQDAMRWGDSSNIGIFKENAVQSFKYWGSKRYVQFKKNREFFFLNGM